MSVDISSIADSETLSAENAGAFTGGGVSTPVATPVDNTNSFDGRILEQAMGEANRMFSESPDEQQAAPQAAPEPVAPEAPQEPELAGVESKRAQERIRQVIAKQRAAEQRAEQLQMQYQQQQAELTRQLAEQQAEWRAQQLQMEERRLALQEAQARREEEAGLSEVERARRNFLQDAAAQAKAELQRELMPELTAVKQQLEQERQMREQARQEAEQAARYQAFAQQAQTALETELLAGFDPKEAQALKAPMEEMLYSFSGAFGVTPAQAAPAFKQFLKRYAQAEMQKISRGPGAAVARSNSLPSVLPQGRSGVPTQQSSPSLAQLKANGFQDHVAWAARGRPALR